MFSIVVLQECDKKSATMFQSHTEDTQVIFIFLFGK